MSLIRLGIQAVRVIDSAELHACPQLNLVIGENGSGKTSLLEAIHILSLSRSFRSATIEPVVRHGCGKLLITAETKGGDAVHRLGLEKGRGYARLRVDGRDAAGVGELATLLPVVALHPDSHELISGPPGMRRQFLDWGSFQADSEFLDHWQRFQRILKQRNGALKQRGNSRLLGALNHELVPVAERVDFFRRDYTERLSPVLEAGVKEMIRGVGDIGLRYRRGWPEGESLEEVLIRGESRDLEMGFTYSGPQRGDLEVTVEGEVASRWASRGQEKLLVIALKLAQASLVRQETGRDPVILVDDLPAELDSGHRERLLDTLAGTGCQIWVTATEAGLINLQNWDQSRMFHVEHGVVRELI